MKVLAINSSPNKDKGNTAIILGPFLEGMKEAGAEVELYYTRDLKINPCYGDFSCWTREGDKCSQDDDMAMLDPKIRDADILVLATPVYFDGVTGSMKNLMDRTLPQVQPFFEVRDNHTRHPLQGNVKESKIALVSNCGLWEADNFDPMISHIKAYCKNAKAEFSGALIRPHGPALRDIMDMGMPVKDIIDACKDAGRQLAKDGKISSDTLNIISRVLLPRDVYVENINHHLREHIENKEKK
ncbi:MAG: flavodoxin family protein [Methanothrix sp.]|jgi:multimeric flavodoxin WrbA|nr:flavodoxin family protein [Methanothrix sp.]